MERKGPLLTEEIKRSIEEEMRVGHHERGTCIEALQIVQRHYGWISDETLVELAQFLGMTPAELDSTATFYNHIFRKPVGRHVILLCDSVSCWIMGYNEVEAHVSGRLGISMGQTTADRRFTMLPIQCLGACHEAPAMMIDDQLFTNLDAVAIDRILERYN